MDILTHEPVMGQISSGGKIIIILLTLHPFIREDTSPVRCLIVCMFSVCLECNPIQAEDMLRAKTSLMPSLISTPTYKLIS